MLFELKKNNLPKNPKININEFLAEKQKECQARKKLQNEKTLNYFK